MTSTTFASDHGSTADNDLPRPDTASCISSGPNAGPAAPRALPEVKDSGRISFGAACRPSLRK